MRNFLNRTAAFHLPERIKQLAIDFPAKIALRNEFDHEITYEQLYKSAVAVAEGLRRTGEAGSPVAVMCKDPIQMVIGLFGTWYSHSTAVPLRK